MRSRGFSRPCGPMVLSLDLFWSTGPWPDRQWKLCSHIYSPLGVAGFGKKVGAIAFIAEEATRGFGQTNSKYMTTHKQLILNVRGQHISVDRGVRDLILHLNNLPGVETYYSCQGNDGEEDAYVQFGGPGAFSLLSPLAQAILREGVLWGGKHRHACCGCLGMTVTLEIYGNGIALRWQPWDYRRVLRIVAASGRNSDSSPPRRKKTANA